MNHIPSKEDKPFRLVKFFTFSSLIVMFTATIIISAMNAHWVKRILQQKSEAYAQLLLENLNHQVFLQFIIPTVLKYGKIKLREKEQFDRMDQVVKATLHSFNVDMVNIYDIKQTVLYSFDESIIGKKQPHNSGYANAVQSQFSSRLEQQGNALELILGFPHSTKIITFAPLTAEKPLSAVSGPVLGVVEIVQDISDDYRQTFRLQIMTVATCCLVMGILFIILVFVVRQGERIIEARAQERLKLEEKLQRSEHLSAIGEMTAGVSHEIRNPLGIITSSAELMKKKMTKQNQSTAIVDIIVEESKRLNTIISDFLDFARPIQLILKHCDIEAIIDKTVHHLSQQFSDHDIIVNKEIAHPIPEINADAEKLHQALLNLLINAFQAMPNGGTITIAVHRKKSDSPRHPITIYINDNGPGIDDAALKKIWNPFFTTKEKGTGLGLGIVKNIIESHQGEIDLFNGTQGGTTVEITLPTLTK